MPALTPDGRLTTAVKKAILLNNLYGVDLDEQAVEVTKLSLLLKCLEGETSASMQQSLGLERVLPTIDYNIRVGNSLVDVDFYDGELDFSPGTERAVKPFSWRDEFAKVFQQGGFDAVIGNPPYIRIQELRESSADQVEYINSKYKTAGEGNFDIYVAFIEKALQLLAPKGEAGYILPHKFLNAKYGLPTRQLLSQERSVERVVHFGDLQVFDGISTYTCLLFLSPRKPKYVEVEAVADLKEWRGQAAPVWTPVPYTRLSAANWNLVNDTSAELLATLRKAGSILEEVTDRIFQGLKTSADKIYILEELERKGNQVKVLCRQDDKEYWLEADLLHPLIKGGDSRRFNLTRTKRLILFPYAAQTHLAGKTGLLPEKEIKAGYPLTHKFLLAHKPYLEGREKDKMKGANWYGYVYPKALDVMPKPKLFTPDIAPAAAFSYDGTGDVFFTGGAAGGYGILPKKGTSHAWLLGLLNSSVLDWVIKKTSTSLRGGYFSYESRYIKSLPIPALNLKNYTDRQRHDAVVALVGQLLALHPQLRAARLATEQSQLQARIRRLDQRLDHLVYLLYGLSYAEAQVIEPALSQRLTEAQYAVWPLK